jgi:hypothetical protein
VIDKTLQDSIAHRGKKLSGLFRYNPKKELFKPKANGLLSTLMGFMYPK